MGLVAISKTKHIDKALSPHRNFFFAGELLVTVKEDKEKDYYLIKTISLLDFKKILEKLNMDNIRAYVDILKSRSIFVYKNSQNGMISIM